MSMVLWIQLENDPEDYAPDDLGFLLDGLDDIDEQCTELQVQPLSEFVDYSDVEYNMSEDELDESWLAENAKWVSPADLLITLQSLEQAMVDEDDDEDLIDEVRYLINRCAEAEQAAVRVRLIAVM